MTLFVGARGPGEAWLLTFAAPDGLDVSAATVTISTTVERRLIISGAPETLTLTDWTIMSQTETEIVARRIPLGTEATGVWPHRVRHVLTIDGEEYRYEPRDEVPKAY